MDEIEEKTWNPDPDNSLKTPPDCFRQAMAYWSTKFVHLLFLFHSHLLLISDFYRTFNALVV